MIHHDESEWGPRDELGRMIAQQPYMEPGSGLVQRIMSDLRPKRQGWLKSAFTRITTPIPLSISPLTASAAVAVLILSGGFFFKATNHEQPPSFTQKALNGHVPVVFRFQAPEARSVSVIGTFNHWDPKGYEMVQDPETGNWSIGVELSPGKHDYVFLVNGKEIAPDPHADISKADDYGHRNSIRFVKGRNGQKI
jgi:Glycogen recognition site of AMP-activated protein kinase